MFCSIRAQGRVPTIREIRGTRPANRISGPEEVLVDGQTVVLAMPQVVVDEPEHVVDIDDVLVVVEELDAAVDHEVGRESLGVIGVEGVNCVGAFLDQVPGLGDPVVFAVTPAPGEAGCRSC